MDQSSIGVRLKLAALWVTMMFLYVYADILSFYRPGELDKIRGGIIGPFDVSQSTLMAASAVVIIPALMISLSLMLPSKINRWTNITAGAVFTLVNISNLMGEGWVYYWAFGILEILVTVLIVRYAWNISEVEHTSPVRAATHTNSGPVGNLTPLV